VVVKSIATNNILLCLITYIYAQQDHMLHNGTVIITHTC
jgi:hypothetical protein